MSRGPIIAGRAVILVQAQNDIQKSIAGIKSSVMRMSNAVGQAGDQAMRGGLLGSIASGFLVKRFADFESSMLYLQTKFAMFGRLAGTNKDVMEDMERTIRKLGSTTTYTAGEIAEAAVKLAQSNLSPTQVTEALGAVLDLARATRTELPFAADAIAKVIKTFKLNTADMPDISSMFVAATRLGPIDLEDLMTSLRYMQGTAVSLKQSLPSVLALLAEMGNKGLISSIAGTSTNTAMGQIAKKFEEIEGTVEGFKVMNDMDGNFSYIGTLLSLFEATKGMEDLSRKALFQDIFNLRGERAASAAVDIEKIMEFYEVIANSQGEAAAAAKTMDSRTTGAIMRLSSAFDDLVLAGGKALSGALVPVFETVARITNQLSDTIPAFGGMVAALMLVPPVALAGGIGLIMLAKGLRTVAGILGVVRSGFNAVFGSFATGTSQQISAAIALYKSLKNKMPKLSLPSLSSMAVPQAVGIGQQAAAKAFNALQLNRAQSLMKVVRRYWEYNAAVNKLGNRLTLVTARFKQYKAVQAALAKERQVLRNLQQLALIMPSVKSQMAPVIANISRLQSQLAKLSLRTKTGQFVSFQRAITSLRIEQMKLVGAMKQLANIGGGKFAKFFKAGLTSNTLSQMARKRFKLTSVPALFPMLNKDSFDVKLLMNATAAIQRMSVAFKGLSNNSKLFLNTMAATAGAITNFMVPGSVASSSLKNGPGQGVNIRALKLWKDLIQVMGKGLKNSLKFPKFSKIFAIRHLIPDFKTMYIYMGYIGDTLRTMRAGIGGGNIAAALNPAMFLKGMAPIAKMGILEKLGKGIMTFTRMFMMMARTTMRIGSIIVGVVRKVFTIGGLWTIFELLLLFGDKIPFVKDVLADFGKAFSNSFAAIGRIADYAKGPLALISAGISAISEGYTGQGVSAIIDGVTNLASVIRNQLISAWNEFFASLGETWNMIRGIGSAIWQMFTALYNGIASILSSTFGMLGAIGSGISQEGSEQGIQKTLYDWVKYFVTEGAKLFSDIVHGIAWLIEKLNATLTNFVWTIVDEIEKLLENIPFLRYKSRLATAENNGVQFSKWYALNERGKAEDAAKIRESELLSAWSKTNDAIANAFSDTSPISRNIANMMEEASKGIHDSSVVAVHAMWSSIEEERMKIEALRREAEKGMGEFSPRYNREVLAGELTAAMVGYSSNIIGNMIKYGKSTEEKQLNVLEDIRDDQRQGLRQRGGVLLGP